MSTPIFVFGSNLAGKHYGGAARYAAEKFGAEMGVGEGLTGFSYALPTMDADFVSLPLETIQTAVNRFKEYATANSTEDFYVTRVGCGIAGFQDSDIAPMFVGAPSNCRFDPKWYGYGLPAWKEVI